MKRDCLTLAGLVLTLATTGCSRSKPAAPVVRMGYFANLTHATALIGVAGGWFQKALGDTKLQTTVFNAGPSVVEAFLARQLDCSFIGPVPAINGFVKAGGAFRIVCGVAANGVVIVAHPQAGISRMEDLAGKRIATPQYGNTQDISARVYLTQTLKLTLGDGPGQTRVIPLANAEQLAVFQRRDIDASWVPEPWSSRMVHDAGGVVVTEEKSLWPGERFAVTVFVVSAQFLAQHPAEVEALVRSIRELTAFINAGPAAAAALVNGQLAAISGKPLDPEVLAQAFSRVEFTTAPLRPTVETFARWSFETGMLKEQPDLTGLFDTRILERVSR